MLPFDLPAARVLAIRRVSEYAPLDDALVAAVAHAVQTTVVRRNTRHFEPLGAACINPWDQGAQRRRCDWRQVGRVAVTGGATTSNQVSASVKACHVVVAPGNSGQFGSLDEEPGEDCRFPPTAVWSSSHPITAAGPRYSVKDVRSQAEPRRQPNELDGLSRSRAPSEVPTLRSAKGFGCAR